MAIPGGCIGGHVANTQRDGNRVSVVAGPSFAKATAGPGSSAGKLQHSRRPPLLVQIMGQ